MYCTLFVLVILSCVSCVCMDVGCGLMNVMRRGSSHIMTDLFQAGLDAGRVYVSIILRIILAYFLNHFHMLCIFSINFICFIKSLV